MEEGYEAENKTEKSSKKIEMTKDSFITVLIYTWIGGFVSALIVRIIGYLLTYDTFKPSFIIISIIVTTIFIFLHYQIFDFLHKLNSKNKGDDIEITDKQSGP